MSITRTIHAWGMFVLGLTALSAAGCVSCKAIPAHRVPPHLLAEPRARKAPINLIQLRQDPPPVYQLGPRDILGVYIETVLGQPDQPPPVHFPENGNSPPALGYPLPVREDGTISLPLVPPIKVAGLTLTQAEDAVRREYVERLLLPQGKERIVVTLIRKRTYQVLVVREDASGGAADPGNSQVGYTKRGLARAVDLKAYENDVLHALSETGGLPGLDAKNEIRILRGAFADAAGRDALLKDLDNDSMDPFSDENPNLVTIPLRRRPEDPPSNIKEEDIILGTGDIVLIETREREVFYTGGLLQGREQLLPRDYDLDVLGAIAVAGGSVGARAGSSNGGGQGFGGGGGGGLSNARGLIPPTEVLIIRKVKGGYQIPIKLNLNRALASPADRLLIQPGDLIILQYTPLELVANIALNNISFNYFLNNFGRR